MMMKDIVPIYLYDGDDVFFYSIYGAGRWNKIHKNALDGNTRRSVSRSKAVGVENT